VSATPPGLVERLLAERIGLDPSSVGGGLIARGVHARMMALDLRSKPDYERALLESDDEVQALIEEVVVPESWFFRDDRPFEVLAGFARAGWLAEPGRPALSALSVPCAGGEEPYSIAMTLLEAGLAGDRFRVDAVDVSARALARAIAGVYGPNSFRGATSTPRSAHFLEQAGAFTLAPSVRSTVRFRLGNLLDPALFADRPPFDAVFCRNLLIYLDDESRTRAFATLGRLVVDGGLLFLGHADRVDQPEGSPFEPTGDKGGFVFRKGAATAKPASATAKKARSSRRHSPMSAPLPPSPLAGEGRGGAASDDPRSRAAVTAPATSPKAPHPGPSPRGGRGPHRSDESPASILDRASILADRGRYDEAAGLVEESIRDGSASARAFFLLGLIAQASGARDRAEGHYLKAIYLDPQHDEALLALASLARRKGDVAAEATYRKRAERVLSRKVLP
jgi:chemotaxis protein methyltransferase WspC